MKDKKVFILRDSTIRDSCKTFLDTLPLTPDAKPIRVTVEEYRKNRSLAQNSLMWKWLTELSNFLRTEHGLNATPEDLKHEFQNRHLGKRYFSMPDEGLAERPIGTSELNTAQFTEFLNEIDVYAANVGLKLPHPEDIYHEAMGYDKR